MIFKKRPLKRRILTLFLGFFGPDFTPKKFGKQHNSTKLDTGFRLMHKLSCLVDKKISLYFDH